MTKHVFIFLGTFVLGAVVALTVRAARFDAHAPAATAATAPSMAAHEHGASAAPGTPSIRPVNTVCAICGMDVDPNLPTAEYQGKAIGFGCKACPPKFKANPDKYGPAALRNEVVE